MYCRNCGVEMADNQAICVKCGVKTGEGSTFCPNCGQTTDPSAQFCLNCGVELKKPASLNLNGQDKIVMALVSFFLGGLGIHNFLMGETKRGITRIVASLCCGIGWILALIDFIRILMDKYEADPTKYF